MKRSASTQWRTVQLGTLCDVCRGSSPRPIADQRYFDGGTIPWIKIADATKSGKYLYTTKEHVNEFGASFSRQLPKGSLIIAASGTLGYPQFLGVEGCAHDGWLIPSNYRGIDKHFLYYLFLWKKEFFYSSAYGAAIQNINTMILKEMEVCVPDLPTQSKIAGVLSAYDDLIENNTRRIAILEEIAQAIYREWFVNFRFPGHDKVKLINSPLGKIPEGWKVNPLSQLVETQYGYTESAKPEPVGPKYLRGMDINKSSFIDWSMVPYCPIADEDHAKYRVQSGDIFVIRMADPGKVGIVEQDVDAVFASYLIRLTIRDSRLTPYYLFHFLLSDTYQGYITGASTGTTRKSASAGVVVGVDLLLPPVDLLRQFEEQVTPLRQLLTSLIKRNVVLRNTRDLLLPKLISGQLDVEELDIETGEPLVEAEA